MQKKIRFVVLIVLYLSIVLQSKADVVYVSSQQEFDIAHDNSVLNDSIIWRDGTYSDIFMDIDKDHLFIMSENLGQTIFTGASRVDITGDYITLKGFQFIKGDIGTRDVINTRGSYNVFTQINIRAYKSYKYLRVREECQYVEISHCNFENRLNLDDQNILSILVDETIPGYHKIQHCSFKNFDGIGNDMGIEPIRIGLSTQADHISRCLVEYCYFTNCDGDGELISSKARQNVYRYNTFENNSKAELVLRHGSESIVYGNFFLNGKGGIRVREGQDHYIYNNYFYELYDRPIHLQNKDSDPLDNINIAFNTIINCAEVRLGNGGDFDPTNVTLSNNIFFNPEGKLFKDQTTNETWISNITYGDPGIQIPASGITNINPFIEMNSEGYYGLTAASPAINEAQVGYKQLPYFPGIADVDLEILWDIMGQKRPDSINEKDIGCSEFPHNVLILPYANEDNTGPSYNTSTITNTLNPVVLDEILIQLAENPVTDEIKLNIISNSIKSLKLDIYNLEGKNACTFPETVILSGTSSVSKNIDYLPIGLYSIRVVISNQQSRSEGIQTFKFFKS